jgi:hypothetical protein
VDKQREALYDFEDRHPWANHNNATLAQCRGLIRAACETYGVPAPTVTQHGRAMSWCIPGRRKISLQGSGPGNKGGKNAATALHEAAHQIVYDLCGNRVDDHGPTFCGVYFHLLTMAGWPASAIRAVAREHGVKWVERPPEWFKNGRNGTKR